MPSAYRRSGAGAPRHRALSGSGAAAGSNRSGRRLCRWRPYFVESSKENTVTQERNSTSRVIPGWPTQKAKTNASRKQDGEHQIPAVAAGVGQVGVPEHHGDVARRGRRHTQVGLGGHLFDERPGVFAIQVGGRAEVPGQVPALTPTRHSGAAIGGTYGDGRRGHGRRRRRVAERLGHVAVGSASATATPQLPQNAAPETVPQPHPGHAVECVIAPPRMRRPHVHQVHHGGI